MHTCNTACCRALTVLLCRRHSDFCVSNAQLTPVSLSQCYMILVNPCCSRSQVCILWSHQVCVCLQVSFVVRKQAHSPPFDTVAAWLMDNSGLSPQTCQCPKAMKKVCDKLKTVWAQHVKKFIPSSRSMKSSARAAKDEILSTLQARGCSPSCSGNQLWKLVPDQVSAGSMRCSACLPLSICVKSKGLKTKISHAHSLILCLSVLLCLSFYSYLCLFLCILCNCYRFPSPSPSLFQSCCCVSFPEISLTPKFHLMIFEHQRLMQVGLAAV
jgi:hypothetical protein